MELLEGTDLSLVLKERGHVLVAEAVDYVLQPPYNICLLYTSRCV